jgi:hypothetical protein
MVREGYCEEVGNTWLNARCRVSPRRIFRGRVATFGSGPGMSTTHRFNSHLKPVLGC